LVVTYTDNIMKTNEYDIPTAYIAHIEACLHKYKSMPVIFFCDANQSCRLRNVLHSYKPRLAVSTYCGLLGVSLLTRTHLAQVQKNTFYGAKTGVAD